MEKSLETGLVQMFEQAVGVVGDIDDNVMNCEAFRAWDELTYPLLYTTGALWSGAAAAMVRSAGQFMPFAADGRPPIALMRAEAPRRSARTLNRLKRGLLRHGPAQAPGANSMRPQ